MTSTPSTPRLIRRSAVTALGIGTLIAAAVPTPGFDGDRTDAVRSAIRGGKARNVILLIGDGMGDSEITIARNYAKGAAGRLNMDELPLTGEYTTYSVDRTDPAKPDYVTDSAAGGTGWATGHKTYNGAISVAPDGRPMPTVLELAKRAGFRTGDVSTAELSDATPAVQAAHVADRSCQGPADMAECPKEDKANGGPGSISEQQVQTGADLYLGGGRARFAQTIKAGEYKGKTVIDQATASGYRLITDDAGLAAAEPGRKLLGLFADGDLPLEWVGPPAVVGGTAPSKCRPNPDFGGPHLSTMARKAIELLDRRSGDRTKGFFLQIEGASIDKRDHAADPCGQIGETVEFDNAVRIARDYAHDNPGTLVVVTADHAHASQIVPVGADSPGQTATLVTADNAEMKINYATTKPGLPQEHTGSEVRIAAQGPQAANVVGITDQTGLFHTLTRALGIDR